MFKLNFYEREKIRKFIAKYYQNYSPFIQELLDKYLNGEEINDYDFILQIYAWLFPQKFFQNKNIYSYFIDILKAKFPNISEYQIIEVASGYLPSLSLSIYKKLNLENPITCIDPKLILLNRPGIIQLKKAFTKNTDTTSFDLLLANCPCDAFDIIIDHAMENPLEMCLQPCPCREDGGFSSAWEYEYYLDCQIERLHSLEKSGFTVETEYTELSEYTESPTILVRSKNNLFAKIN